MTLNKRNYYSLLLLLLICGFAKGQEISVDSLDYTSYLRAKTSDGKLFTGVTVDYRDNVKYHVTSYKNGYKSGKDTTWLNNGNVFVQNYNKGKRDGYQTLRNDKGQILFRNHYKKGYLNGDSAVVIYDSLGTLSDVLDYKKGNLTRVQHYLPRYIAKIESQNSDIHRDFFLKTDSIKLVVAYTKFNKAQMSVDTSDVDSIKISSFKIDAVVFDDKNWSGSHIDLKGNSSSEFLTKIMAESLKGYTNTIYFFDIIAYDKYDKKYILPNRIYKVWY